MNNLKIAGLAALMVGLVGLGIWYEVGVWNECRETNSWMYCMRVLSK